MNWRLGGPHSLPGHLGEEQNPVHAGIEPRTVRPWPLHNTDYAMGLVRYQKRASENKDTLLPAIHLPSCGRHIYGHNNGFTPQTTDSRLLLAGITRRKLPHMNARRGQ
jgi:hypothetical protein